MPLSTVESVKTQAGIPVSVTVKDAQYQLLINAITSLVKKQFGRDIERTTYTEYHSGDNTPILILNQFPAISITSICFDQTGYGGFGENAFPVENNLVQGLDYMLKSVQGGVGASGEVIRLNGVWEGTPVRLPGSLAARPPNKVGNIKVVYVAGFLTIPPSIVMAVNSAVIKQSIVSPAGGVASSMAYEDGSISFANPDSLATVFASVENVLAAYTDIPI